ncbi:isoprenyl transferase [Striga asiatica]|uniref:Isoprenyl transferase n=1 Tax=Striga asiatica TaxID=4170 RepID=A0A5A7RFN1_STRAF|nr:isoprenyl transferase [Striga asiatica]
MQLILEKIEGLTEKESIVNQHGVRVSFIGNLKLVSEPVKLAAERAMRATERNSRAVLSICIAYTSTDEIVRLVKKVCIEKKWVGECCDVVDVADVDRGMYMAGAPDVDVLVRSSGETRLSNFLLWHSACALLYSPQALWPKIGFRHLVRAVLDFLRSFAYLEKRREVS